MARTATLTVTHSTNPATAHIGPFFADLRVNGRQTTRVGTAANIREFILGVAAQCLAHNIILTVSDETYKQDFTACGGLIGMSFSD